MRCGATAEDLADVQDPEECTSYTELGPGHIISSRGDEYIKIRGFEEEPNYYMWVELVSIEEDTLFCRVMKGTPDDSEYELSKGDIVTCEQKGKIFIYLDKV
jgi:hypothetical protein